jgi:polyisoprenoid-binding protein YceI
MKKILFILLALGSFQFVSAQKLVAKDGHIWFYSYTPMEEIEAHNQQVVSILDETAGTLQFNLLVKSFEFKRSLMQEHFNENYMESDTYPKSSFSGTITNNDKVNYKKDGTYPVEVTGDLTIHGVTKKVTVPGTITVSGNTVNAKAKFTVDPKDYNIIIPDVVREKFAKVMDVNVDVTYPSN